MAPVPLIPFTRIAASPREQQYLREVVEARQLAGGGEFSRRCEEWLRRTTGARKALLAHSGTAALEAAAVLSGVGPGDEVIMPSFTFPSTANAFVLRGAVPVFVDIRPRTFDIDPEQVAAHVTPRTRVIVPVHYAGVPCEMDSLVAIAEGCGALVIEDAAQALLSEWNGRPLGAIGAMAAVSFHQTKNVSAGEAGALLVNREELVARADVVFDKGTDRVAFMNGEVDRYTWVDIGSSYRPSELVAAFLLAQLEVAQEITDHRRRIWDSYHAALEPLEREGFLLRPVPAATGNAHIYPILLPDQTKRDVAIRRLSEDGIVAVFHYVPLHSSPAGRRFGRTPGAMAVTDDISRRLLRLPIWSDMTADDVAYVVRKVGDVAHRK